MQALYTVINRLKPHSSLDLEDDSGVMPHCVAGRGSSPCLRLSGAGLHRGRHVTAKMEVLSVHGFSEGRGKT